MELPTWNFDEVIGEIDLRKVAWEQRGVQVATSWVEPGRFALSPSSIGFSVDKGLTTMLVIVPSHDFASVGVFPLEREQIRESPRDLPGLCEVVEQFVERLGDTQSGESDFSE